MVKGFVEIFNVLLRNIGPLLEALIPALGKLMLELIKALPDILLSLGEALWEAIKGIGKFIVNLLIDAIRDVNRLRRHLLMICDSCMEQIIKEKQKFEEIMKEQLVRIY